jgi:hypothetical protein
LGLGASRFGAGERLLGGDQELDVVQIVASGWVDGKLLLRLDDTSSKVVNYHPAANCVSPNL